MKAIILGTGATIGTCNTKGGVVGFVERLNEVCGKRWKKEYPDLERAIDDCGGKQEKVGLDQLWTRIDYYSKFRKIFGSEYGANVSIQLHKAILDVYSLSDEIEQVLRTSAEFTLKKVLSELKPGDALISFNWDTLAETIALQMLGKNLVQVPYPYTGEHIRLIKPHGSLSWVHKSDGSVIFQEGRPLLIPMAVESVHDAEPLVLGTLPIKSELLEEVQRNHLKVYETITAQWREVVDVLSRVSEVVVVGYSFPKEDEYGRFILREAIRRRPKEIEVPQISYYALERDRGKYEEAFREVFSNKVNYTYEREVESAIQSNNDP